MRRGREGEGRAGVVKVGELGRRCNCCVLKGDGNRGEKRGRTGWRCGNSVREGKSCGGGGGGGGG